MREIEADDEKIFILSKSDVISTGAFSSIYAWKEHYTISIDEFENSTYIYFNDGLDFFLYIPPKPAINEKSIHRVRSVLCDVEKPRIENASKQDAVKMKEMGCVIEKKYDEYVYLREDIALLRGNKYKSKRASYNQFNRSYNFVFRQYTKDDFSSVLNLYGQWSCLLLSKSNDSYYNALLRDSKIALEVLLLSPLSFTAYVLEVDKKIIGFILAVLISENTEFIQYEFCLPSYRGSATYIFSEFCKQSSYKYINAGDGSNLENLERVKLSFKPVRLEEVYTVYL